MNLGQTVFSQLIEYLPHEELQKCVARYRGDHYLKSFSCWDQFLATGSKRKIWVFRLSELAASIARNETSIPKPPRPCTIGSGNRSEEHTSEPQSHSDLVCRL